MRANSWSNKANPSGHEHLCREEGIPLWCYDSVMTITDVSASQRHLAITEITFDHGRKKQSQKITRETIKIPASQTM